MIARDGFLYQAYSWTDTEAYRMANTSVIVVVDTDTDDVVDIIEANCPDLNVATQDQAGNIYFSNWVYSPVATIINGDAEACVVKLPKGQSAIDDDATFKFADVTGGHEGAALTMTASGKALVSIFFEGRQEYDPNEDIFDWIFGENWKTMQLDLETLETTEVEGIGWNGGGMYTNRVHGVDYLLMPIDSYQSTELYSLDDSGKAHLELTTKGWATRVLELR
jgi:hypothetical protein